MSKSVLSRLSKGKAFQLIKGDYVFPFEKTTLAQVAASIPRKPRTVVKKVNRYMLGPEQTVEFAPEATPKDVVVLTLSPHREMFGHPLKLRNGHRRHVNLLFANLVIQWANQFLELTRDLQPLAPPDLSITVPKPALAALEAAHHDDLYEMATKLGLLTREGHPDVTYDWLALYALDKHALDAILAFVTAHYARITPLGRLNFLRGAITRFSEQPTTESVNELWNYIKTYSLLDLESLDSHALDLLAGLMSQNGNGSGAHYIVDILVNQRQQLPLEQTWDSVVAALPAQELIDFKLAFFQHLGPKEVEFLLAEIAYPTQLEHFVAAVPDEVLAKYQGQVFAKLIKLAPKSDVLRALALSQLVRCFERRAVTLDLATKKAVAAAFTKLGDDANAQYIQQLA